ncbi:MAG: CBS domain-containing protein [Methanomicrobium sp.]|jgi:CBS domain-containing protein|uniref:CBS domain-containing protein n=1 Tax=Methanomicrobium mobile TaxID=2205 RepID=UPI0005B2901D|nr:CBS domain-containing protein [Methanomicrobium mobile]MBO7388248.1 CBS domain-containing protein [Methanomicrobium sp.]MBP5082842.1 CBS domain-containing protein [Methanomicrobium sp.]MBP5475389.1 CBS domain-containing protein [Methanomicrobium sp.]
MSKKLLIKDVMSKPVTIAKSAVITEALDKMLDLGIDPLVVTNNDAVVGTISRKAIADVLGSKKTSAISPTKIHVSNKLDEEFTSAYPDQDAEILVPLLQEYKVVVVLNEDHKLVGKVDATDLLAVMTPQSPIDKIMQNAHTVLPGDRVIHLRRKMIDAGVTKFVVVNEDRSIAGVVTETDVARSMRKFRESVDEKYQDNQVRNLFVSDIMTSPALCIDAGESTEKVKDLIVNKRISSVPVTRDGKLVGIISKDAMLVAL